MGGFKRLKQCSILIFRERERDCWRAETRDNIRDKRREREREREREAL